SHCQRPFGRRLADDLVEIRLRWRAFRQFLWPQTRDLELPFEVIDELCERTHRAHIEPCHVSRFSSAALWNNSSLVPSFSGAIEQRQDSGNRPDLSVERELAQHQGRLGDLPS